MQNLPKSAVLLRKATENYKLQITNNYFLPYPRLELDRKYGSAVPAGYPFATDEARLECLFKLYEKMTVSTNHLTATKM